MNLALIAHDSKKNLMQNFCIAYRGILAPHTLHSTGTTGRMIEDATNLPVRKYLSGDLGGVRQLVSEISNNDIDMVLFLRDPNIAIASEPDVGAVFRACDVQNIPIATNLASAELLIHALDRGDLSWREMYR